MHFLNSNFPMWNISLSANLLFLKSDITVNKQQAWFLVVVWKENVGSTETVHFYYYTDTTISKCQKTKSGINKFSEPEWLGTYIMDNAPICTYLLIYKDFCSVISKFFLGLMIQVLLVQVLFCWPPI